MILAAEAGRALESIESAVETSAAEITFISQSTVDTASRIEDSGSRRGSRDSHLKSELQHDQRVAEADWFSRAIKAFEQSAEKTYRDAAQAVRMVKTFVGNSIPQIGRKSHFAYKPECCLEFPKEPPLLMR